MPIKPDDDDEPKVEYEPVDQGPAADRDSDEEEELEDDNIEEIDLDDLSDMEGPDA
jgi:hypothetical protein